MNTLTNILVAEDDPSDAFFLKRAFNRAGIAVALHFVQDGQEVIEELSGEPLFPGRAAQPAPQLLLLDLKMPRLNGFEVLSWIRRQPRFKHLPVIIFSSSDEPKDVQRAYDLGADSFVLKPHSVQELNGLIGRFKKTWLEDRRVPGF